MVNWVSHFDSSALSKSLVTTKLLNLEHFCKVYMLFTYFLMMCNRTYFQSCSSVAY